MASQFYIVHHHFKPGMAGSWWGVMAEADETAQAAMAEKWLNMGYFNHCFMPLSQEGHMYCGLGSKRRYLRIRISRFH